MDLEGLKALHFIHHSTYLLRAEECWVLFDYYTHSTQVLAHLSTASTLPLYILCTHSHHDHYSPEVLSAFRGHEGKVHYLFHHELKEHVPMEQRDLVTFIRTGEVVSTPHMEVKAYGSTDLGGSFRITLRQDHFTVFYAGDLNCWHWNQEASPDYIRRYIDHWHRELDIIVHDHPKIDLLMFPTDLRLGPDYLMGLHEFLAHIPTRYLAPMHLNGTLHDLSELRALNVRLLTDAIK